MTFSMMLTLPAAEKTIDKPVIWGVLTLIGRHRNEIYTSTKTTDGYFAVTNEMLCYKYHIPHAVL